MTKRTATRRSYDAVAAYPAEGAAVVAVDLSEALIAFHVRDADHNAGDALVQREWWGTRWSSPFASWILAPRSRPPTRWS
jgi:hypothetical protein